MQTAKRTTPRRVQQEACISHADEVEHLGIQLDKGCLFRDWSTVLDHFTSVLVSKHEGTKVIGSC
jgi:hypothetical protein